MFYCWMLIFAGSMLGLVTSANLIVLYSVLGDDHHMLLLPHRPFRRGEPCAKERDAGDDDHRSRRTGHAGGVRTDLHNSRHLRTGRSVGEGVGTSRIPPADAHRHSGHPRRRHQVGHLSLPHLAASAMVAPTPVSAYLHSATMVKAGVFLVARFSPVFAGVATWEVTLVALGLTTLIVGGMLALRQSD